MQQIEVPLFAAILGIFMLAVSSWFFAVWKKSGDAGVWLFAFGLFLMLVLTRGPR